MRGCGGCARTRGRTRRRRRLSVLRWPNDCRRWSCHFDLLFLRRLSCQLGQTRHLWFLELGGGRAGDELAIHEKIEASRTSHLNPCLRTSSFRIHGGGKDCLSPRVFGRDPLAGGRELKQKRILVHPGNVDRMFKDRGAARVRPNLLLHQGRDPFLCTFYNAGPWSNSPMFVRNERAGSSTRFFIAAINEELRGTWVGIPSNRDSNDVCSRL